MASEQRKRRRAHRMTAQGKLEEEVRVARIAVYKASEQVLEFERENQRLGTMNLVLDVEVAELSSRVETLVHDAVFLEDRSAKQVQMLAERWDQIEDLRRQLSAEAKRLEERDRRIAELEKADRDPVKLRRRLRSRGEEIAWLRTENGQLKGSLYGA